MWKGLTCEREFLELCHGTATNDGEDYICQEQYFSDRHNPLCQQLSTKLSSLQDKIGCKSIVTDLTEMICN